MITQNAQFIGVCSSVAMCSKEEGRGKGSGEKASKAMAEEQRALHNIGEAAYTVNGLQRGQ
jgi:hypothetical protein